MSFKLKAKKMIGDFAIRLNELRDYGLVAGGLFLLLKGLTMPSLLDISILVAGGLFLPIRLPCFFPGVMEHSPACLRWAASLAQPMTQHVFLIEMGKNLTLTLVLLCAWASLLQTSVATKKAVLRAVASLMSIQNLWAAFVAHGLASPEMPGEPYLKRVFGQPVVVIDCLGPAALMVAAILTAPDAKAGKKK